MTSLPIEQPPRERLFDIDAAKGLAILLVVFGHIVMRDQPQGNEWYQYTRDAIYTFHMPFFMYLSGLIMFYSGAAFTTPEKYRSFIKKRAIRFLLPFFGMGLIIYFGKVAASKVMHVDNNSLGVVDGLTSLFWTTHTSPATSLWYIFVMFFYCLIIPPLLWVTKGRYWPIVLLSVIIYCIPLPKYIYMDKISHNFMFFMMGACATLSLDKFRAFLDRWKFVFIPLFAASLLLIFVDMNWLLRMAIAGTLSIFALHGLIRMPQFMYSKTLLFFGKYSFVIYLFNTIMIGLSKGVMLHILPWDGINFLLFVPILFAAGAIGPILIKLIIFRRIKWVDNITN